MVKHFNIIMAGLISGIVALFTTFLGVSGTVIGSVLSSVLYQVISSYSQEKYEANSISTSNISGEIVYIFPLIVIAFIEFLYFMTFMHYNFIEIFNLLEAATQENLFRVMGCGMILLSFYPFLNSNSIKKYNGVIVFLLGGLLLLRGFTDFDHPLVYVYDGLFNHFDFFIALIFIAVLVFVIINIIYSSIGNYNGARKVETSIGNYNGARKDNGARKVETSIGNHRYEEDYPHSNYGNKYSYEDQADGDLIYLIDPNDSVNNPKKVKVLRKVNSNPNFKDHYSNKNINPNMNSNPNWNYSNKAQNNSRNRSGHDNENELVNKYESYLEDYGDDLDSYLEKKFDKINNNKLSDANNSIKNKVVQNNSKFDSDNNLDYAPRKSKRKFK